MPRTYRGTKVLGMMNLNQRPSPLSPHFFSSTFPALPPAISDRFRHYRRSPTITSISKALHHRPHHRRSPTISAQTLAAAYLRHHRAIPATTEAQHRHHRSPAPPPQQGIVRKIRDGYDEDEPLPLSSPTRTRPSPAQTRPSPVTAAPEPVFQPFPARFEGRL
ncbi:hypothetical protein CASFOL_004459 [Castilleja foliolosa]|uniref:Uncharacterized protein n=1 Tax=Castilleja foliolosa TaxID=1961234 RepID=A0ABD3ECK4_9LAMI